VAGAFRRRVDAFRCSTNAPKEIRMNTSRSTLGNDRYMKRFTIAAAVVATAVALNLPVAGAQMGGYGGYGPGMMGGYGGYGPGMMGGYGGYGPGMMGGYGGYGPGMMGGYGGYGPGTMGGYGGYGMGPGMMYGYDADHADALNLTDDQREKIAKIQEALFTKHWELMGKMREQQLKLREQLASGKADDASIGKAYKNVEALRQQMWASGADAQKQIDAVLTKAQRDQLRHRWNRDAN
jgi:Spy/CpxP family protein refolding chaperone